MSNDQALYQVTREQVIRRARHRGVLVDLGCGAGSLYSVLGPHFSRYVGVDLIGYQGFPAGASARRVLGDLESGRTGLREGCADVVCSIETIEHLENPRALFREIVRIVRPGGLVVVTTPNQLSLASKISLLVRNEFMFFQERPGLYPSHVSALLEIDLVRMARENGLEHVEAMYTGSGRIPLTSRRWPWFVRAQRGSRGRAFSDNVIVVASRPEAAGPRATTDGTRRPVRESS
ncbi:MAG: methyltransferase domain-containing protein [Acidobacteria bacterium]|nr:methyltransferase domain-containing protein [Acidobacteriota bacterium]